MSIKYVSHAILNVQLAKVKEIIVYLVQEIDNIPLFVNVLMVLIRMILIFGAQVEFIII